MSTDSNTPLTLRDILFNLAPLFLIKKIYRDNPPTASFRTAAGRTFRVVRVDDNFCIAIAAEDYDPRITEKLLEMHKEGERLQQAAIKGLNNLTTLEKSRLFKNDRDLSDLAENYEKLQDLQ